MIKNKTSLLLLISFLTTMSLSTFSYANDFVIGIGDGVCPPNYSIATRSDIESNESTVQKLLDFWQISRVSDDDPLLGYQGLGHGYGFTRIQGTDSTVCRSSGDSTPPDRGTIIIGMGDGVCPANYSIATRSDVERNKSTVQQLLGFWQISRVSDDDPLLGYQGLGHGYGFTRIQGTDSTICILGGNDTPPPKRRNLSSNSFLVSSDSCPENYRLASVNDVEHIGINQICDNVFTGYWDIAWLTERFAVKGNGYGCLYRTKQTPSNYINDNLCVSMDVNNTDFSIRPLKLSLVDALVTERLKDYGGRYCPKGTTLLTHKDFEKEELLNKLSSLFNEHPNVKKAVISNNYYVNSNELTPNNGNIKNSVEYTHAICKEITEIPLNVTNIKSTRLSTTQGTETLGNGVRVNKFIFYDLDIPLNMSQENLNLVTSLEDGAKQNELNEGLYIYVFRTKDNRILIRPCDEGRPGCSDANRYPDNIKPNNQGYDHVRHSQLNGGWEDVWCSGFIKIGPHSIIEGINNDSGHFIERGEGRTPNFYQGCANYVKEELMHRKFNFK